MPCFCLQLIAFHVNPVHASQPLADSEYSLSSNFCLISVFFSSYDITPCLLIIILLHAPCLCLHLPGHITFAANARHLHHCCSPTLLTNARHLHRRCLPTLVTFAAAARQHCLPKLVTFTAAAHQRLSPSLPLHNFVALPSSLPTPLLSLSFRPFWPCVDLSLLFHPVNLIVT